MALSKIISGGQTGADIAGLQAAKLLGLATGGWMPKSCRTESGMRLDYLARYDMREHSSPRYAPRTRLNVKDAEATLLFGNKESAGTKLTIGYCLELGRPWALVKVLPGSREMDISVAWANIDVVTAWLVQHKVTVLNVAGNRESTNPGIEEFTRNYLTHALVGV